MPVSISPHYEAEKLEAPDIDDIIDVYEDRIQHWVIEPAKLLANTEHGGPAAFCILLTYFEGAWSYLMRKSSSGRSKEYFKYGFTDAFTLSGNPEQLLLRVGQLLYEDARCGFFHDGLFRGKVFFADMNRDMVITLPVRDGNLDIEGEIQSILIDVKRCISAVEKHFSATISSLRDTSSTEKRAEFFKFFKSQCDWEQPGPIVGIREPGK
ncbi:hypothetical protein DNK06_23020 [Pseudomonas daroniae]|uniref:Uncharacterized protein n=1 Tax=Phytopseudomonas daroniae TaxID=2487519 RepID=A0A4Q9QH05_9GAMM|nr:MULTISPECIES: hypothetical protein [Pseudomonas]TBU72001.1 hypothetical protein DNK06_23020 [Pseudomonas daroniae]TBU75863.1 hypothetical protein DNK31_22850 [Pseudomonas sp. FRB 228]TBU87139.1 hypothetical protein DNJ99_22730 [Pseudomonas daroniae]